MASKNLSTTNMLALRQLQKLIQNCKNPEDARIHAQDILELGREAWTNDIGPQIEQIARQHEQFQSGLLECYQMCQRVVWSFPGSSIIPHPKNETLSHSFDVSMGSGIRRHYQITGQPMRLPPYNVSYFSLHFAILNFCVKAEP